jgi:hypothetical protein
LIIGPVEEATFATLAKFAEDHPVDMGEIMEMIKTPAGKAEHVERMTKQSVALPLGFLVTYSVETGHPAGTCRHLSMSSPVASRVPSPEAVWMVAEYFGFKGGLGACVIWDEELQRGQGERQIAINIVQPLKLH